MRELRVGLFFSGFSLLVIYESLHLGLGILKKPGPGFITFCAAILLLLFSLVLIFRGWRMREPKNPFPRRVMIALGVLILYSLVLDILGFSLATFLMVALFFRLGERRSWWSLLGMAALVTSLAYLIFGILLNVYFPRGFLGR